MSVKASNVEERLVDAQSFDEGGRRPENLKDLFRHFPVEVVSRRHDDEIRTGAQMLALIG